MTPRLRFRADFGAFKKVFVLVGILTGLLEGLCLAQPTMKDENVFRMKLDPKPFSQGLCRTWESGETIKIRAAQHRDLIINRLPGQTIPTDPMHARSKNYTHFMTMQDLTDGKIAQGAIAFRQHQTAIFTGGIP